MIGFYCGLCCTSYSNSVGRFNTFLWCL